MHADSRLRIIVLGYIVRGPLAGFAWHHLQYVLGLKQLGHDVYFVEDSDDYPACYDPEKHVTSTDPTYGLKFIGEVFERVGLSERWTYYDAHRSDWRGPRAADIKKIGASTDLLLNVSGVNPIRDVFARIPTRVLIDTDPVFTQIRHLTDERADALAGRHTAFMTFGENIGAKGCSIPNDGYLWQPTRQPIVLDAWPVTGGPSAGRYTTVMQWDSYAKREYDHRAFGMKSESFDPYLDLPSQTGCELELALGSSHAPRDLLQRKGWRVRDPLKVTRDPWTYQQYLRNSRAEFSVAKHGYVAARSGWFSERSACYLACGRPVIVQDTGFSTWLETEGGVIPFSNPQEALDGIESISARYERHCAAARHVVERYFDSQRVLSDLVERATSASIPSQPAEHPRIDPFIR